jgi:mannose-1-phosphate guanylyltransferase
VVDAGDRLVALVGVRDLVVVETPDAMWVCRKDRAQDVRRVVVELEARGWRRHL